MSYLANLIERCHYEPGDVMEEIIEKKHSGSSGRSGRDMLVSEVEARQ